MKKNHFEFDAVAALFVIIPAILLVLILSARQDMQAAELDINVAASPVVEPVTESVPEPDPEPVAPISDVVPLSWGLQQAIVDNCEYYNLDVNIILGIIDVESDFRENADNGLCYGLMQIHRGNQSWVRKNADVIDIFEPEQNIRAGCWILAKGIEVTDTLEQALVWYNAGEVYADSTNYSRQVLKEADKWAAAIAEG